MIASSSNFYQVGASLPVNALSYVQRKADEEFYQKLQAGKFCYVLNSRQMGKSSLRVQIMQRLQKEGTVCVAIDLTGIGKVNQEQWYGGIVRKLVKDCKLKSKFDFNWRIWWEENQAIFSPVQCLSLFVEEVLLAFIQQPIVIFVDEIDKVLSQEFSADDFFALIRFFQNQRVDNPIFERLTFALLGVATPGDLIVNKTQTPFNIGEAIELHGFKIDEVEPLIKGLEGRFDNPLRVMTEILHWTGGQPFLTQKLCKFMVEESEKDNPNSVEEVVNNRIIENWESQDNPEHLRTIRDRILSSEQRAGYLLELYQQIQQQGEVAAKKNVESNELKLSGLVVFRVGKLRAYNQIYQQVFNKNWVETQLKNLRPYSEAFRAWVDSDGKDESRLLRGKALEGADKWAKNKNLSFQDKQFLAASKEKEIAVRNQKAELERERKDREAAEKINLELSEANRKAKIRIRNGTVVLIVSVFGGLISVAAAWNQVNQQNIKHKKIKVEVETVQQLSKLAEELRNENLTAASDEALRQAGLSFRVNDHHLKQAMLLASMSQAYQNLNKPDKAKEKINESLDYLNNKGNKILSAEGLQIKVLVKANQGILLTKKSRQRAIKAYQEAFYVLRDNSSKTNPFQKNQILTTEDIESVHRGLLNLQPNRDQEVWQSLKEHFYARLDSYLKSKDWRAADITTDKLMLFIADREEERHLNIPQIENFSCSELKKIDNLWVQNSNNNFGFSVQKKIWLKTGNRLGIKPGDWKDSDYENYLRFAFRVGWYNNAHHARRPGSKWVGYKEYLQRITYKPSAPSVRGGLPFIATYRSLGSVATFHSVNFSEQFRAAIFSRMEPILRTMPPGIGGSFVKKYDTFLALGFAKCNI